MIATIDVNSHKKVYGRLSLKFTRADGTVRRVVTYDAHSLVANFWRVMHSTFRNEDQYLTDISGNGDTALDYRKMFDIKGSIGDYKGIIVGTSNAALEVDQRSLSAMINHGSAAGELTYYANSVLPDPDNRKATISRNFENMSGATISVNEVGLTAYIQPFARLPILITRDVLPAAEDVLAGEVLSISYEIFFTHGTKNYQALFGLMNTDPYGNGEYPFRAPNGNLYNGGFIGLRSNAPENNGSYGILLGNGDTPVSLNDYDLASRIGTGSAVGQLNNTPVLVTGMNIDNAAGTVSFDIVRGFINNTPAPISITEMGLFSYIIDLGYYDPKYYLLDRIVFPGPVTIQPKEQRIAKWLFRYSI